MLFLKIKQVISQCVKQKQSINICLPEYYVCFQATKRYFSFPVSELEVSSAQQNISE